MRDIIEAFVLLTMYTFSYIQAVQGRRSRAPVRSRLPNEIFVVPGYHLMSTHSNVGLLLPLINFTARAAMKMQHKIAGVENAGNVCMEAITTQMLQNTSFAL